ncbi:hypothetical protein [Geothrix edaphica]|uniref:hypothetical protein n=1 Tax=Geothrix edaphica TaxID=2927976 RepID=UPI0025571354|nr:hypothetical protein [Geothrix edaphica]
MKLQPFISIALICVTASAGDKKISDGPGIPAKSHRDWSEVKKLLARAAKAEPDYSPGKEVFLVSRVIGGQDGLQFVWWKNRRRILVLYHPLNADDEDLLALKSKYCVNLDTGVVPTDDDINGSTYLVSQAWVDDRLQECKTHGVLHVQ